MPSANCRVAMIRVVEEKITPRRILAISPYHAGEFGRILVEIVPRRFPQLFVEGAAGEVDQETEEKLQNPNLL